jgi:thioredoxin reductase (NADPH)
LEVVGVKTSKSGKIVCRDDDSTDGKDIFAIGDVADGRLELTPTAILAGKLLARRLFGKANILMNYKFVPTTVFTPLEYGCCGYSQEDAVKEFGEENVVAYSSKFKPLEWNLNIAKKDDCYAKLVVNKKDNGRVVGFHYLGPNAGEVTQGFALGLRKGATKEDFDFTVGIHPTCAEEFTVLSAIAGSGEEAKKGC